MTKLLFSSLALVTLVVWLPMYYLYYRPPTISAGGTTWQNEKVGTIDEQEQPISHPGVIAILPDDIPKGGMIMCGTKLDDYTWRFHWHYPPCDEGEAAGPPVKHSKMEAGR